MATVVFITSKPVEALSAVDGNRASSSYRSLMNVSSRIIISPPRLMPVPQSNDVSGGLCIDSHGVPAQDLSRGPHVRVSDSTQARSPRYGKISLSRWKTHG